MVRMVGACRRGWAIVASNRAIRRRDGRGFGPRGFPRSMGSTGQKRRQRRFRFGPPLIYPYLYPDPELCLVARLVVLGRCCPWSAC